MLSRWRAAHNPAVLPAVSSNANRYFPIGTDICGIPRLPSLALCADLFPGPTTVISATVRTLTWIQPQSISPPAFLSFDRRTNVESRHSQRVWQPLLVMGLKEHFVLPNPRKLMARCVDTTNQVGTGSNAVVPLHRRELSATLPSIKKKKTTPEN